jgi:hypothetical protein
VALGDAAEQGEPAPISTNAISSENRTLIPVTGSAPISAPQPQVLEGQRHPVVLGEGHASNFGAIGCKVVTQPVTSE